MKKAELPVMISAIVEFLVSTSGLPSNDRLDRITKELIDDTRETAEMRSENEPRRREGREGRERKPDRA